MLTEAKEYIVECVPSWGNQCETIAAEIAKWGNYQWAQKCGTQLKTPGDWCHWCCKNT